MLYAPGIPNCANAVLKIDPSTDSVTTIGQVPAGGWKWHGGLVGADGNIYGFPSHCNTVLKIEIATGVVSQLACPELVRPWGRP